MAHSFSNIYGVITVHCSLHYLLQIISELPTSSNGNFDIHWYRKIPGVVAASSFDGKIGVHNLEVIGLFDMRIVVYSQSIMAYKCIEVFCLSLCLLDIY